MLRTRYDKTVAAIEEVFEPNQVFYGFFEDMFNQSFFDRLSEFLEIKKIIPNFDVRVNASESKARPDEAACRFARKYYLTVYKAIEIKFGREYVRSLWQV